MLKVYFFIATLTTTCYSQTDYMKRFLDDMQSHFDGPGSEFN